MTKWNLVLSLTPFLLLGSCALFKDQASRGNNLHLVSYSINKVVFGKPSTQPVYTIDLLLSAEEPLNKPINILFDNGVSVEMTKAVDRMYTTETRHELNRKSLLRFYISGAIDTLRLEPPLTIQSELRQ